MVIGIIGAGISGLTAGRKLSKAGHDVTVIEKSRGFGGRLATRYAGKENAVKLDHGLSWFHAESPEFKKFTAELIENDLVKLWGGNFSFYSGGNFYKNDPTGEKKARYTAPKGMNSIGKYLARWVDVKLETKAGGLTYLGGGKKKKRSWMINLTGADTFEADAVIIAAPAPQAYGILMTSQDETDTLKIIRHIDEVNYDPVYSLMAGYEGKEIPEWEGIVCNDPDLGFISNEALKREGKQDCSFVIHSSPGFARKHRNTDPEIASKELLTKASRVIGAWAAAPDWTQIHFWRYSKTINPIPQPFLELNNPDGPLALIGDYFGGNSVDHAYCSGLSLANHWIDKLQV